MFGELMDTIEARFTRPEPRRRVRDFVAGLLAPLPVKNCWTIAEHAGDAGPGGMQDLIGRASWDDALVRADVRDFVAARLGRPEGILLIDETGDLKKGTKTVGVVRWGAGEVPAWAGPFPAPSSRTGQARFRASGSPVTTA
ncbi:SRSO17 transposase [Plantactinospora soyae]|uniref:SRSO17 transposase n=1 Tax=Plantactinospora soyae TaxID=1544732 RepID=A0A927MAS9_9ACTN|nr:SRSO17 transposase [Plantactinospora soyae]